MSELYARFESIARRDPNRVAVRDGNACVLYGELDLWAKHIAASLEEHGVVAERCVGIHVEPQAAMIAAVLGAARVGATYVPLEVASPDDRLSRIIGVTGMRAVLAPTATERSAFASVTVIPVDRPPRGSARARRPTSTVACSDQALYVLFTSGSTGHPKGVVVTHRNLLRLLDTGLPRVQASPDDVWSLFHALTFDFSEWELWGPLTSGASVVVVPATVRRSPIAFYQLLIDERVTILNQTPSAFYALMTVDDHERKSWSVQRIVFGGERLDLDRVRSWRADTGRPDVKLINMYGITETTVHVTAYDIPVQGAAGASIIGTPLPHLTATVMTEALRPVVQGEPGELFVGGDGVARGYLNAPGMTAERFVPDPDGDGTRLYRTGDVVRNVGDQLEYCGRLDNQLKLRGHRIEPEEIERVLEEHQSVAQALVTLAGTHSNGALRAHLVPLAGHTVDPRALRAFAETRLPPYMVPSNFSVCAALPLTVTGKVDRRRAMDLADAYPASASPAVPHTELERSVCAIVARALGVDAVGVDDNFFERGGHSLLLVEVAMELKANLAIELDQQAFFANPTVRTVVGMMERPSPQPVTTPNPLADDEAFAVFLRTVGRDRGPDDGP